MKEFIQQWEEVMDIRKSHGGGNDMRSEYDQTDELCRKFSALIRVSASGLIESRDELVEHLKYLVEEDEIEELKTFIRSLS